MNRPLFNQARINRHTDTISQALNWSCQLIEAIDAHMLLQHVLQVNHAFLLTHADDILLTEQAEQFTELVLQRVKGVPVAYLTGERAFYDLVFKVTSAVLIPRPETELLVELALSSIPRSCSCDVLDLGTGSGAIGITIAKHRPQAYITAVELSEDAMAVAQWNAHQLNVDNISFILGSWFEPLAIDQQFDVIVSNPPYVAVQDPHLQQGDLRFEPDIALSADDNGQACIRNIITKAPRYLVDGGHLLLEHGYDQSEICRQLLKNKGFDKIKSHQDLAGIERVSGGRYFK